MDEKKKKASQASDLKAIEEVLSGREEAFAKIQNKYSGLVAGVIRRMIKDEDDVSDLVQETFIKSYRALHTYKTQYSFSAWLFKIASNTCIDFLRKKRFNFISIERPGVNQDDSYEFDIKDDEYLADTEVLGEERKKVLREAIDSLQDNYRTIIKLRHEQELEYAEIAEQLDIPLGTVKAHLFRARKILLEKLKDKKEFFFT